MSRVIASATVSLDGFIADKSNAVGPQASADYINSAWPEIAVTVIGGNLTGQALAAGLVDELSINLVPVVFGTGIPFFGTYAGPQQLFDNPRVIEGDRVTHLHYRRVG